jgi:hypothetical protein
MSSVNHTTNYGLTQYSNNGTDKIEVMADYNSDMLTIDKKLKSLEDRIKIMEELKNA